jgi:hypothetical protein
MVLTLFVCIRVHSWLSPFVLFSQEVGLSDQLFV